MLFNIFQVDRTVARKKLSTSLTFFTCSTSICYCQIGNSAASWPVPQRIQKDSISLNYLLLHCTLEARHQIIQAGNRELSDSVREYCLNILNVIMLIETSRNSICPSIDCVDWFGKSSICLRQSSLVFQKSFACPFTHSGFNVARYLGDNCLLIYIGRWYFTNENTSSTCPAWQVLI